MKIIQDIKGLFRKLTPLEVATHEMQDAELAKLGADTAGEYAKAISDYNAARIRRLKIYVNNLTVDVPKNL